MLALLALGHAEGLVQQLLLALDHLLQLAHHLLTLLHLAVLRHLQVLEHLLQLRQHLLGRLARAGADHLADRIQHLLQILPLHLHGVGVERHVLGRLLAHLLRLLDHGVEKLVQGPLQLGHQPLQLLVARALLQRLAQRLLELAQLPLGQGQAAVLEMQRGIPKQVEDVLERRLLLVRRNLLLPLTLVIGRAAALWSLGRAAALVSGRLPPGPAPPARRSEPSVPCCARSRAAAELRAR